MFGDLTSCMTHFLHARGSQGPSLLACQGCKTGHLSPSHTHRAQHHGSTLDGSTIAPISGTLRDDLVASKPCCHANAGNR